MSDSSSQQHVLFAQGLYRVQRFWGSLNNGLQFSVLSSVAVGSDGAVYCAQRNGAPVLVFEPDGELRATWPRTVATDPHGINIIRGTPDTVLLVDRDAHQVLHCTVSGEIIARLGERDRPAFKHRSITPRRPLRHLTAMYTSPMVMEIQSFIDLTQTANTSALGVASAVAMVSFQRRIQFGSIGKTESWLSTGKIAESRCLTVMDNTPRVGLAFTSLWTSPRTTADTFMSATKSHVSVSSHRQAPWLAGRGPFGMFRTEWRILPTVGYFSLK